MNAHMAKSGQTTTISNTPTQGVLIMAGGTGGHIFPGLAVADVLKQKNIPVRWLGAEGGMETKTVPAAGIEIDLVAISGLRGKGLLRWLTMPMLLLKAVWNARKILEANRPGCAVSFGGYAAAPGGIAAWTKGIPVLVHEQNRVPGMTNKLLARFARRILQGFPGTFPEKDHAEDVGNPVRAAVAAIEAPQQRLAGRSGPIRILVTGGSQGAMILNKTVAAALALLPDNIQFEVQHQAGAKRVAEAVEAYEAASVDADIKPFIDDMAEAYAWADVVICRSGALTVAELAAAGLASVLVPFALAVDDHQTRNAEYLADAGAAVILPQSTLDAATLAEALKPLLSDRKKLVAMACAAREQALPDAAEKVVAACGEWVSA
jgi:UDP-N-acetylglucosamine--N-acetylmuramyl-(pentapeptide) pyrophosphoryl-undecaprenol N-acetylglucosamine transferase